MTIRGNERVWHELDPGHQFATNLQSGRRSNTPRSAFVARWACHCAWIPFRKKFKFQTKVNRRKGAAILMAAVLALVLSSHNTQAEWEHPLSKQGRLGSPLVEVSPFVFRDRLFRLENNQKFWEVGGRPGDRFHEDEVRIRDVEKDEIVSVALTNHAFATVLVHEDRVYVFAGDFGNDKPWRHVREINMTSSGDLVHWSRPITIFRSQPGERLFNTALCRGKDQFVLLYETDDRRWPGFTFRYCVSDDLVEWTHVNDAVYGRDKYVGGPALYYENGTYYTLYLEALGNKKWETRITRSTDLRNWQEAPIGRPFVTFDPSHQDIPLLDPEVRECNASDAELCYFKGKTIVYFTGSDQTTAGDLQWATYDGSPGKLVEFFFDPSND